MIYVKRSSDNTIEDIGFSQAEGYIECSLFDKDIQSFLNNQENEQLVKDILKRLDDDMVRVIEDVIQVLIDKDLMLFTDLPEPVQNKLMFKKSIRESLHHERNFYEEEELTF